MKHPLTRHRFHRLASVALVAHLAQIALVALIALIAGALPGLARAAAPADLDATALLARADEYRNFRGRPFSFQLVLESREDDAPVRSFTLKARIRDAHTSLVIYDEPSSEQGKALLMDGNNLWFSTPNSSRPIRITPQQRLLGEASNGDVASTDFSGDYEADTAVPETVDGKAALRLELKPKAGSPAAYGKVQLWLQAADAAPLKADFFAPSGKLLKTAHYTRYETLSPQLGGKRQLTELEIVNALNPGKRTVMRYSAFKLGDLPESMFTTAYLARLR